MKRSRYLLLAGVVAVAGCGKKSEPVSPPPPPPVVEAPRPPDAPDFSRLLTLYAVDTNTHTKIDKALTAADKGDYPTVLRHLQSAAQDPRLKPEQRQALQDVILQVQNLMAKTAATETATSTQ